MGRSCASATRETPWWDAGREVVRAQPFYRYVVHDALVAAGRADLIPAQCRDWAWALERSATSLTETWYGGTISHGWSSTPTRDLVQRVLGVTPAEPGFAVASIEPELGDLEWAAGAVPTPAGLLHVEVRDGSSWWTARSRSTTVGSATRPVNTPCPPEEPSCRCGSPPTPSSPPRPTSSPATRPTSTTPGARLPARRASTPRP